MLYEILEKNIKKVIDENEEVPVGISAVLLYQVTHNTYVDIDILNEFADRYNVSIDWLLDRTDKDYL